MKIQRIFLHKSTSSCVKATSPACFVTAWIGILTISTNTMVYANAGHNPPLISKKGQAFSHLKCRPGFILAGMENTRYVQAEIMLEPGDSLFLYTDGVSLRQTDSQEELYGEERHAAA